MRNFVYKNCFSFLYFRPDKKPKPENIDIYTLKTTPDRRIKVTKLTLADVWKQGCIIRINNFGDKEKTPHSEKDIKNQVCIPFPPFTWHAFCFLIHFVLTKQRQNHLIFVFDKLQSFLEWNDKPLYLRFYLFTPSN